MKKRYRLLLCIGIAMLLSGCKDVKEENDVSAISDVKVEEMEDTVETIADEALQEWQIGTLHVSESENGSELQFRASCDEKIPNYSIEIKSSNGEPFQTIMYEKERTPDLFQPNILVEDADLDGNDDILLYLGIYGNGAIEKYACYVFDIEQQQYVSVEGFEELSNPSVDGLFLTSVHSVGECQTYKKYRLDGKELVLVGELTEKRTNDSEGQNKCIYDETLYMGDEIRSQKCDVEDFEVDEDFWGDYIDLSYTMEEIEETFFGEWEVTRLLGFSEIQNEYTNYPDGHDIIGNRIIINKDVFSSVGLEKYERYQSEVLNPIYEVPDVVDRFLIYNIDEAIKEDSEIYDMIREDQHQTLEITGMRDGRMKCHPDVQIGICNGKLVVLSLDGVFYLLERVQ